MSRQKIMIVEDEAIVAEDIRLHIEDAGYEVVAVVGSGEKALELLQRRLVDLVFMDIMLAGELDGIDVAEKIKQRYRIPVIFLTAYSDQAKLDRARLTEPYGYLIKPFDDRELRSTLAMALYKAEVDAKIREGKRWTDTVLRSVECGVITVDTDGHIITMNPYAENIIGRKLEACVNESIDSVFQIEKSEEHVSVDQVINQLVSASEEITLDKEYQLVPQGADTKTLNITFAQLRVHGDEVDGVVVAFTDVTHLKEIEVELRYMNAELADVLSVRTEVLSSLNRELELEKGAAESASLLKGDYLLRVCANAKPVCESVIHTAEVMIESGKLSKKQCEQVEKTAVAMQGYLEQLEDVQDIANIDNKNL